MAELQIGTVAARFRLPTGALDERRRLGGLLREAFDAPLAQALELVRARHGIGPGELLCLRRVHAPVRLRLGTNDAALVTAWGLAVADAIEAELAAAPSPSLVRYRSRGEALSDLTVGAATGDLRRAWAWCRSGLIEPPVPTTAAAAVEQMLARLVAEPEAIVPAVRAVADAGALPALAARLGRDDWSRLAESALRAAGGAALAELAPPARVEHLSAEDPRRAPALPSPDTGLLARAILAAELSGRPGLAPLPLAVLAALDADPGIGCDRTRAARAVAALVERLQPPRRANGVPDDSATRLTGTSAGRSEPPALDPERGSADELASGVARPPASPSPGRARSAAAGRANADASGRAGSTHAHPLLPARAAMEPSPAERPAAARSGRAAPPASIRDDAALRPGAPERRSGPRLEGIADAGSLQVSADLPSADRDPARTRHGGLVFLLPILRALDLPARMAAAPVLAAAPLRLGLYRLGLGLAECPADDPALAAFCGLPALPDPSCGDPDDPALAAAVGDWSEEVRCELARRCVPDSEAHGSGLRPRPPRDAQRTGMHSHAEFQSHSQRGNEPPASAATLAWLVEREAQVIASPGWIELVFSLDQVSLVVRRAGLDLDPGWVPWLGVVIRYRYE